MPPRLPSLSSIARQWRTPAAQTQQQTSGISSRGSPLLARGGFSSNHSSFSPPTSSADALRSLDRDDDGAGAVTLSRARQILFNPEAQAQLREDGRSARARTTEQLRGVKAQEEYMRQTHRRWNEGEVYSPHDLAPEELSRFKGYRPPRLDVVDLLEIRPLDEYQNFAMISEYMTPMGRIKHSKETGLRLVNQRRMAKAIRRAIGLGIHPSVHSHPEILKLRHKNMPQQSSSAMAGTVGLKYRI